MTKEQAATNAPTLTKELLLETLQKKKKNNLIQ